MDKKAIAIFQIFISVSAIFAFSYFANSSESTAPDYLGMVLNSIIKFISIKQIGSVSATSSFCCEKSTSGALCFDTNDSNQCDANFQVNSGLCEYTGFCQLGTCVNPDGKCSANSPQGACESGGGVWKSGLESQVPECNPGCCVAGSNNYFQTQTWCNLNYPNADFHSEIVDEATCNSFGAQDAKGACVLTGGNCRITTQANCISNSGNFNANLLCSDDSLKDLGVDCKANDHLACGTTTNTQQDIYQFDSCGNEEKISQACNYPQGMCKENNGVASCADLSCKADVNNDGVDEIVGNGESWCIYQGSIGNKTIDGFLFGSDIVGSEDFMGKCINGKVTIEAPTNSYRRSLCAQKKYTENGKDFFTAEWVPNLAEQCYGYNPLDDEGGNKIENSINNCNNNPHCMVKNVEINQNFKFDICLPKYPVGFNLKNPTAASGTCAVANRDCIVIYRKEGVSSLFGGGHWSCIQNCECQDQKFAEEMNNICISLGDCGDYINVAGEGTDNTKLSGYNAPAPFSWTNYADFAKPVANASVPKFSSDFYAAYGGSSAEALKNYLDELPGTPGGILGGILKNTGLLRTVGIVGKSIALWSKLAGVYSTTGGVASPGILSSLGDYAVSQSTATWGYAALAGVLGGIIGGAVAKQLGISGEAATALILTGSGLGIAYATNFFGDVKLTTLGWWGLAIVVIIYLSGWGQTKKRTISFTCEPWQAPVGGQNCDKCNNQPNGALCTQYQCESLGQACILLNPNTDSATCESATPETNPPVITTGDILKGYEFTNQESGSVKIQSTSSSDGCIPENIPVNFTLKMDEKAQCKWSFNKSKSYSEMENYPFDGNYFLNQHIFAVGGLSVSLLDESQVSGDIIQGITGDINIYVKCQDYFGNVRVDPYVVNFCVNKAEDQTAPFVNFVSPANGAILSMTQSSVNLSLWTNEPAYCSYSTEQGKDYADMTPMTCPTEDWLDNYGVNGNGPCTATLNNLGTDNNFYIKCKDKPWETDDSKRNTMVEDYTYNIKVTDTALSIDSVSLTSNNQKNTLDKNKTTEIDGGGDVFISSLEVKTSGGADNGNSRCSYEFIESPFSLKISSNFIGAGTEHTQDGLNLPSGDYNVSITCTDDSKNIATDYRLFKLNVDSESPVITRIFGGGELNFLTNEPAICFYSSVSCGNVNINTTGQTPTAGKNTQSMTSGYSTTHSASWSEGQTYYIRCIDVWNNENTECKQFSESFS